MNIHVANKKTPVKESRELKSLENRDNSKKKTEKYLRQNPE